MYGSPVAWILRAPRSAAAIAVAAALVVGGTAVGLERDAVSGNRMEMRGMTFTSSEGGRTEVVLRATRAALDASVEVAHLEGVRVRFSKPDGDVELELSCERGRIDLASGDFEASGDVRGRTADGRRFATAWMRYDDARALAYTDADVEIEEAHTRFRGSGLRYHVQGGRLQLLKASVVQSP